MYDLADRIIEMTLPSGRRIEYQRDEIGRVLQISTELNNTPQILLDYIQYRADQAMTQCSFGNGLLDQRSYDLQGRLTQQELSRPDATIIDSRSYIYDANGNIIDRMTKKDDKKGQP